MSYWNSSNNTPSWRPVPTSPSIAPAIGPATRGRALLELRGFRVAQVDVAQPLRAPGTVVHAAHVDAAHAVPVDGERREGVDIARDEDADAGITLPIGELL